MSVNALVPYDGDTSRRLYINGTAGGTPHGKVYLINFIPEKSVIFIK